MRRDATAILTFALVLHQVAFAQNEDSKKQQEERFEQARQVMITRANEVVATASDREKPGRLSPAGNISLSEMEARWEKMLVQNKNQEFSTVIDEALLRDMATSVGCHKIIGILPTGFPQDSSHRQKLNGATLFAKCAGQDYAIFKVASTKGTSGSRHIVTPESFNSRIDGNPARQLFFKSENGLEKTVVAMNKDDYLYTMEYWSQDTLQKKSMSSKINFDNLGRVVTAKANKSVQ